MACIDNRKIEQLLELMSLEQFIELTEVFITTSSQHLQRIHTGLQEDDAETVRFHAHALKGSCGNIGCPELETTARELEQLAQAEQLDNGDAIFQKLQRLHQCVVEELQQHSHRSD